MEKLKYWAIGIASTWVLLAFIAWNYESTCGMFLSGACFSVYWDGLRSFVLLTWLDNYQTLIAGLAAVAGGAAVIVASREQILAAKQKDTTVRREEFKATLAIMKSEILHITDFIKSKSLPNSYHNLEFTRRGLQVIAVINPTLLHITLSVVNRLEFAVSEKLKGDASGVSSTKMGWHASIGYSFVELLKQLEERFDRGDNLNVIEGSFDGSEIYEYLNRQGQSPMNLFELSRYFRWPPEYVMQFLEEQFGD